MHGVATLSGDSYAREARVVCFFVVVVFFFS